jgi:hypothetical protein
MGPRIKRLMVKASALSLIVNGVLLFAKFREQGRLSSHDYQMAAASFATTLVVIAGITFVFMRFGNHPKNGRNT